MVYPCRNFLQFSIDVGFLSLREIITLAEIKDYGDACDGFRWK